jgi:choline dehydrogenase
VEDSRFDFIVVGAGSAGCVVASRLSEDADVRVLLIEAGGSDRTTICRKPGMVSIIHTIPQIKKRFDWGYRTAEQTHALKRTIPYPRGRVLGGSSAINGMVFVRGNPANFDSWEGEGNPGWGWNDVLPLFKRLETFEDGETDTRGGTGPIQVTRAHGTSPVSDAFGEAVAETAGVQVIEDYNSGSQEGAAKFQMSARDGVRYSTSEGYIHPNQGRKNLQIALGTQVARVVIEGGRATGVEMADGMVHHATREVVLCAGAIGSTQLLMLSGVGPADHLGSHGIAVKADLPVGDNLHDHLFFPLTFLAPQGGHRGTFTHFMGGMIREYLCGGGTWFSRTVFETIAFLRSGEGGAIPDLQIHSLPWAYPAPNQDSGGRPVVDPRPALTVQPTLIYPKSRGTIRLRSADPNEAPAIDPNFLAEPADRDALMRGIELVREIMGGPTMSKFVTGELEPGPSFGGDALLKELPNRVATVYHPVGTCRMGVDDRAVVGPDLKVRGIDGLRVADASIMPSITGGNTNAPCIMIGEKCADLIMRG